MTKKCNAITHSVNIDGIRLYYEKPEVITFQGRDTSMTEAYLKAFTMVFRNKLQERWIGLKVAIEKDDMMLPPHSLFCECHTCASSHVGYTKTMERG